ncbi:bifunctional 3'-5' exonuclease/ATP-dependent helicase WRN isoform 7-T9 [Phoenicopterus ruber ruber]
MNKMDLVTTTPQDKYPQWMLLQNQEGVLGDKKKSAVQRSVLEDGLPFLEFRGSVVYSYEASDCSLLSEDIRQSLSDGAAVGFDIEWPPSYTKGKMAKIAVIQICATEEKCYLFHISSMSGFPKGLKRLLEDETIKKVGVGIEGDQWKLMSDFEIKLKSFVELADVANEKLKCKEIWSLNGLVKHLFGKQLLKDKSVRCSNWEEFPLTEEQKLYAATDAYAGFITYQKLKNMNNSDWKLFDLRRDDTLSEDVKERLTSLAEEITDLASRIPVSSGQLENLQRASEILANISENVSALRSTLLGASGSPSVLERSCGATPTKLEVESANVERQKVEMPEFAKKLEGDFNICSDATLAGFWEGDVNEEAERGNTVEDGAVAASSTDKADRDDFMSLDITEQELQILEREAAEEFLNEAVPEEACSTDNEQNVSCVIESDEELEMEMLKSLEDVDNSKGALTERESNKARKTPDTELNVVLDGEEDEGIEEEEEESWDPLLPVPTERQIVCLKEYFGHSAFKPVQWKVINSVLEDRRDNLVVMATGYGKSLCYQFPPVYTGYTGIVICPLISLMEDQVLQLTMSQIPACLLGSAQSKDIKECIKAASCLATSSDSEGGLQDFGKQAYQLLSAVSALEEKFGTTVPILFLRGSSSQRLPERYRRHPLFGSGKDWPENWWKLLSQQLIMEGFLKEVSGRGKFTTTCVFTQKGRNWLSKAGSASNPSLLLQSSEDLNLQKPPRSSRPLPVLSTQRSPDTKGTTRSPVKQMSLYEMFSYERKVKTSPTSSNMLNSVPERSLVKSSPLKSPEPVVSSREKELEAALYGKLLTARQKIANEKVIPPAVLATNKILVEMARVRPTTVKNVKRIDGVSEAKSTMLIPLLAEIKDFCQVNGLQTDVFPTSGSKDQTEASPWKCTRALSPSEHVTYVLFQEKNLSVSTISESRSLPLSEVGTHLFQAMKAGYPVNLERAGLTPEVQQIISDVIRNPPIGSDTTKIQAIRKLVPANIELYLIRMTIALLEKEDKKKSRGGSSVNRMLVWSDEQQEKKGADQASREDALWNKTKGNLINPTLKEGAEKTHPQVLPSASAVPSVDDNQPGSRGAAGCMKPIMLASWNQPALNPDEEELFADAQPKEQSMITVMVSAPFLLHPSLGWESVVCAHLDAGTGATSLGCRSVLLCFPRAAGQHSCSCRDKHLRKDWPSII